MNRGEKFPNILKDYGEITDILKIEYKSDFVFHYHQTDDFYIKVMDAKFDAFLQISDKHWLAIETLTLKRRHYTWNNFKKTNT